MFDSAREYSGIPYYVNSCCRCEKHNAELPNASPTSSHIATKDIPSCAMDVRAETDYYRFRIVYGLIKAGFVRILIYPKSGFIHADTDPDKKHEILVIME